MTTSLVHHDSHGDGYLRDGMDASSPSELVESVESDEDDRNKNYASVTRTPATEVLDPMENDDEEKMEPSDRPKHAGFWDHSMVNVRLHVLKLWARTGKIRERDVKRFC